MRWLKPVTARWSSLASIWGGGAGIYTIRVGTAALGCPGERSSPAPRPERKKPFLTPLLRTPRNSAAQRDRTAFHLPARLHLLGAPRDARSRHAKPGSGSCRPRAQPHPARCCLWEASGFHAELHWQDHRRHHAKHNSRPRLSSRAKLGKAVSDIIELHLRPH